MSTRHLFASLILATLALAGCGREEPPAPTTKARTNVAVPSPKAAQDEVAADLVANEALKERLARQEAATKMFDKGKSESAPAAIPARPEPARAEAPPPAVERASPPRAIVPPPPPIAAKSEPAMPALTAAFPPAPQASVQPAAAQPPPVRTDIAAARPVTPPPGIAPAKLLARIDPEFPREAVQAAVEKGLVKARMTLDGSGNVTRVEVIASNPGRLFDRAVVRALSQWRFSEGPSGRTVDTEVEFKAASRF